ncbi:glycosyltransferase [Pedobacter sp. SYSU D00535]|uniref:glycosyltransferase family 2 protein n=1 Tax=Pedobacter sp. SYSU D00535 TaxID=2810308 RepID=UPI001A96ED05|nr:glycosyltransferase [Pedobacter sp. SYSU D00535]
MVVIVSVFTILLALVYVVVVLFFRRGWKRISPVAGFPANPHTKVSVLIAARNEEAIIAETIEDILKQDYPKHLLELIIVDDHSTDKTAEVVASYAGQGAQLIRLNENQALNSYKKKAITEAINKATGELVITTDADCRMGNKWLRTIVGFYEATDSKLISSPVLYFKEKSLFERLQTLEFLYLIGLGASSIGNKMPSTCNGANLAYRRDVFFELKGFKGIDDLASGDDELFLHKVASAYPNSIGFCKSEDAVVYTYAKSTLKEFIRQRKRWASKSTRYKDKKIVVLGVAIWAFNVMIFANVILGFFNPQFLLLAGLVLLLKATVELIFLVPLTRFARRSGLIAILPVLTLLHILYIIYIGVAGNSGKYVWKERLVR